MFKHLIIATLMVCSAMAGSVSEEADRKRQEFYDFGERLATCTPFHQKITAFGETLTRDVHGLEEEHCKMSLQALGPYVINCTIPEAEIAEIADAWNAQARTVQDDGSIRVRYDSKNPDPLTAFLNSPACETVEVN